MPDQSTRAKVDPDIEKISTETIDEARMVLPGIQALFGFQLIAVFNEHFQRLARGEQILHYAAALLVAVSIALIMTPAAYHRQAEQGQVSDFFVRLASWLIAVAMAPLMTGLCLEVFLLGRMVLGAGAAPAAIAGALFVFFFGCWFVFPWAARLSKRAAD